MRYHPLKTKETDNVGLKKNGTIGTYLQNNEIGEMSRPFHGMSSNHEDFFKFKEKIDADSTLSKDAKSLLIGHKGESVRSSFNEYATELINATKSHLKQLTGSLYTNTAKIDSNQVAMVGLVGARLSEEGLSYLDRSEYIHPIATMLAKAELLPDGQSTFVLEKLNQHHSSDTLLQIKEAERVLEAVQSTIDEETELIDTNTPTADHMERLKASSALAEIKKLTAGV